MTALLVAAGAAVGAPARYLVGLLLPGPRGTLLVNLLGSLLLGVFTGRSPAWYALLGTGLCGAFTTYSAFAVEAVELPARRSAAYVVGSVVGCVAAAALGLRLAG